ncbi:MAG: peptide-methionine (S)-S-oxide reductase MsrA [Burkholderiales bacterium]|nr:peptide-methionine (S)-S-oxide reductase MsrA [Burkholderiales bacterium]MBH2017731.1 peptide-methionine (S)-S-oxide reductase MsrA [Burkholderiales bacterium]
MSPSPTPNARPSTVEEATFAAGCFWCIETAFNQLRGVLSAESGYSNGAHPKPDYESVCSGRTGHAEVVRVRFDPSVIRYGQLLEVFFALHDPTTLNRQGHDVGTQYRSGVYTHSAEQAAEARALIEQLNLSKVYPTPIVTEVAPVANYHPAEAYHQGYVGRNPHQGYCVAVVAPKLEKFQRTFTELLRPEPQ